MQLVLLMCKGVKVKLEHEKKWSQMSVSPLDGEITVSLPSQNVKASSSTGGYVNSTERKHRMSAMLESRALCGK